MLWIYSPPNKKFYTITIITMDKRKNNHWAVIHWFGWKKWNPEAHVFYSLYCTLKGRCNNPNNSSYKNYGARWIKCLWNTFEQFRDDMYESYLKHLELYWRRDTSIDRIDNNWDYCKENCKRATRLEQSNNRRNISKVIVDGIEYKVWDIARIAWIWIDGARMRIKKFNKWRLKKEHLFVRWDLKKNKERIMERLKEK
jgi:hypothetical protein